MAAAKLPTSHSGTIYLVGRVYDDAPDEVHMMYLTFEPSKDSEFFLIEKVVIEHPINWRGVDPTQRQVAKLREIITNIQAEAQRQVTQKQGEINRLLQLTHSDILDKEVR